jgi:NAD(P)-dependent dehydrogenase (short-subunit alcohol dehydrogenase family)
MKGSAFDMTTLNRTLNGAGVLVTGANRGIGQQLVDEALRRGAGRVYAGSRGRLAHPDPRVRVLALDVTDADQVGSAVAQVGSLDVLINNAGIAIYDDLSDATLIERHLAVNLFGLHRVTMAFVPLLARSSGAVVNNLSVNALAPLPLIPAYSLSKAAAFSLTQSLRVLLRPLGIAVQASLTGPVDTDMTRALHVPKASPQDVARGILDGVESGEEEIFPDVLAQSVADTWRRGAAKTLERQFADLVAALPAAS